MLNHLFLFVSNLANLLVYLFINPDLLFCLSDFIIIFSIKPIFSSISILIVVNEAFPPASIILK